jgi:hypothetical protein
MDMQYAWDAKPEGKRRLKRPRRRWDGIIKWITQKLAVKVKTGFNCLRTESSGGFLNTVMKLRNP